MTSQPAETPRYHALDSLRAVAMLLGVVYHSLIFRMMVGGPPGGPMGMGMGGGGSSRYFQDWLHGFRMPLFFLISGFFGRMMLRKYGTAGYLKRRWLRIGIPMVVGMFTFGPAYVLTREALSSGPGGGPPGAGAFPGGGGELPPPPPGFVPPPLVRFDEDGDGSLGDAEWKKARVELDRMSGGGPPGGFSPGGPGGGPPPGFGPGGPGGPIPGPFGGPGGGWGTRLFGANSRLFQLNHLWFLWYLLLFASITPFASGVLGLAFVRPSPGKADRLGGRLIRSGLAPIALGIVGAPALMLAPGMFGWSLGIPPSIFRAFPDFLLDLDPDMAFYFLYFLSGWFLHRERDSLQSLSRAWLPDLILGVVAFAAATWLDDAYRSRSTIPNYAAIRWGAYTLSSIGSAASGFALLGFFQRYLDRPSLVGRYLADTALWVYLVHQPLVLVGLAWLVPYRLPWVIQTAAVSAAAVAASLVLYEALVRPTAMVRLFGPAGPRRTPPLATPDAS